MINTCVFVPYFVHTQIRSQGFPLGSDHEAGSGGDKPEQEAVTQPHARLQDLRLLRVPADRPAGSSGDTQRGVGGPLPHVPRCLPPACYRRGVWLCPVYCGVENPPAFQNPNGTDDTAVLFTLSC